jgi:DNA-binding beta-propeller fold protein YncE
LVFSCFFVDLAEAKDSSSTLFDPIKEDAIVWPLPPEPARIAYVRSLQKSTDIKTKKGFFKKVAKAVFGERIRRMVKPYGIVVDSKGRVIVVDSAVRKIHIFDIENEKYKTIESTTKFAFTSPIGATVDISDNIYISDSGADRVLVFNSKGRFQFSIDGLNRPTGLAIDHNDHILYVVNTGSHNVKIYDLKGTYIKTLGGRGSEEGEFNFPTDIFISKNGDIYISDTLNFRVQKFNNHGRFLMSIGSNGDGTGNMGRPKGVAVDPDGHIYVVDAIFDTVQIFDQQGNFLLNFGETGAGPGMFWLPTGIYIDSNYRVYVADSYNRRLEIFEYLGDRVDVLKR